MWAPPSWSVDMILLEDGTVQYASAPVHGSWTHHLGHEDDTFKINFHHGGDDSLSLVHYYKRIEGTHAWQLCWKDRGVVPQHKMALLLAVLPET